jgi:hypothetical protein
MTALEGGLLVGTSLSVDVARVCLLLVVGTTSGSLALVAFAARAAWLRRRRLEVHAGSKDVSQGEGYRISPTVA